MTSTNVMNQNFEGALFAVSFDIFKAILLRDSLDPQVWGKRLSRLKTHGLTTFVAESGIKAKEIEVDKEKLEDPRYRRQLIRKLKAPRPSKWTQHELPIDRSKLASEPDYLEKIAKLLAYKWSKKLLPVESPADALLLLKQDVDSVTACLDAMGNHQSDGHSVSAQKLRSMVEEELDKNETFNRLLDEIRAVGAEARAKLAREMAPVREQILRDFSASMDELSSKTSASCDEYIREMKERSAASQARTQAVLDAEAARDPETEWREALAKADQLRRQSRPKLGLLSKSLVGLGILAGLTLLGFHLEVAGVTPFEAIGAYWR